MICASLFDLSGVWSDPWRATHDVVRVDLQADSVMDVLLLQPDMLDDVDVVLAAPPCTHFTKAGARWWPQFDADGRTAHSIALVNKVLDLVGAWKPRVFALENPVGRMPRLCPRVPQTRWTFHPYEFAGWTKPEERTLHYGWLDAEQAVKSTVIFGNSVRPIPRPEAPCDPGGGHTVTSWIGPGKDRANKRSVTPLGVRARVLRRQLPFRRCGHLSLVRTLRPWPTLCGPRARRKNHEPHETG